MKKNVRLKELEPEKDHYEKAMRRALAREPFLRSDGRYLSRDEAHDRSIVGILRETPS